MQGAAAGGFALAALLLLGAASSPDRPGCVVAPYRPPGEAGAPRGVMTAGRATGPAALTPAATTGSIHVLVILAEFADLPHRVELDRLQDLLFGPGPSLRDYYDEVSGGQLALTGDLVGWVSLPEDETYYSQGSFGVGEYPHNGQRMAEDAVQQAVDGGLDLGSYDADGDGTVDVLLVIHSGQGYEWAGATGPGHPSSSPDPNSINSHKWSLTKQEFGAGTPRVVDYFTCPELQLVRPGVAPGWTDSLSTVGVYCHEFGHILGLPDFYDTDTFQNRVGVWDIMDFGTWNRVKSEPGSSAPGARPAHYSAWSKMFLGWYDPVLVAPAVGEVLEETLQLGTASGGHLPLQLLANPFGVDWSSGAPGSGEFFLGEVRTLQGYDAGLPSEGLLLYHVDEGRTSNRASENGDGGGLLLLLPQDGTTTASSADTTDAWPGAQATFGPASDPASDFFDGSPSGVTLSAIGAIAAGTVSLTAEVSNLRAELQLPFARPNPFRPSRHGTVGFVRTLDAFPSPGARLVLFDVQGRRIRTLDAAGELAGDGRVAIWDGRTEGGRPAAAGVYFFRVEGSPPGATGRVVLLR